MNTNQEIKQLTQDIQFATTNFLSTPERRWDISPNDELSEYIQLTPEKPADLSNYGISSIYSSSGFDAVGIISRVYNRPNPRIDLGPVDFSTSFIVVDAQREDLPIVFASQNFVELTGYEMSEVLGRNCRFLQAPDGIVQKGSIRRFVDNAVIYQLKKSIEDMEECQFTQINYKKGGKPFVNLITIIPLAWDNPKEIRYFVGFQVDLEEQAKKILGRIGEGTYSFGPINREALTTALSTSVQKRPRSISPDIKTKMTELTSQLSLSDHVENTSLPLILEDEDVEDLEFQIMPDKAQILRNLWTGMDELSETSQSDSEIPKTSSPPRKKRTIEHDLLPGLTIGAKTLLESIPDFTFILSSRGIVLHVSPKLCKEQLGYEVSEMVGKMIGDLVHPNDSPSLARELRSASPLHKFNVHFRFQKKDGGHVWVGVQGHKYELSNRKRTKCFIMSSRTVDLSLNISLDNVDRDELIWSRLSKGNCIHQACFMKLSRFGLILHSSLGMSNLLNLSKSSPKKKEDLMTGRSIIDFVLDPLEKKRLLKEFKENNGKFSTLEFTMRASRRDISVKMELYPCNITTTFFYLAFIQPSSSFQTISSQNVLEDIPELSQNVEIVENFAIPGKEKGKWIDVMGMDVKSGSLRHQLTYLSSQNTKMESLLHDLSSS